MQLEWRFDGNIRRKGTQYYITVPLKAIRAMERKAMLPMRDRAARVALEVEL